MYIFLFKLHAYKRRVKENKKGSKEHINIFILIDATEKDVMHFLLALRHNNYYTGKMYKPCAETTYFKL